MGLDRDFNVYNILTYYDIDDLDDLDDNFNAPYHDDGAVDLKIETIDICIHLLLMKEDFHREDEDEDTTYSDEPLIDMDTDEFADDSQSEVLEENEEKGNGMILCTPLKWIIFV